MGAIHKALHHVAVAMTHHNLDESTVPTQRKSYRPSSDDLGRRTVKQLMLSRRRIWSQKTLLIKACRFHKQPSPSDRYPNWVAVGSDRGVGLVAKGLDFLQREHHSDVMTSCVVAAPASGWPVDE